MSSKSMPSGDPYCSIHGFNPCMCGKHPNFPNVDYPLLYNPNNLGYLYPALQEQKLAGVLPEGVSICEDVTKPKEVKLVKKWAEKLRETAQEVTEPREMECLSAYIFFLERSKIAAKRGNFSTTFETKLPWTREELESAAELLEKDGFDVEITTEPSTPNEWEVIVSWE